MEDLGDFLIAHAFFFDQLEDDAALGWELGDGGPDLLDELGGDAEGFGVFDGDEDLGVGVVQAEDGFFVVSCEVVIGEVAGDGVEIDFEVVDVGETGPDLPELYEDIGDDLFGYFAGPDEGVGKAVEAVEQEVIELLIGFHVLVQGDFLLQLSYLVGLVGHPV